MSMHDSYIDRMAARFAELEHEWQTLSQTVGNERQLRDLEADLAVARKRLQALRRAGADVTDEMTQSFTQCFERIRAAFVQARAKVA
jgi:predicted  nucleic acid-binding Zn-ribbon protein